MPSGMYAVARRASAPRRCHIRHFNSRARRRFPGPSDYAIREHGVGDLDEPGDVGALEVVHVVIAFAAVIDAFVVNALHGVAQQILQLVLGPAGPGDLDVGRPRYRRLAYTGNRQVVVQFFRAGRGYLFNHRHHFGIFEQGVETANHLFPIQPHLSSASSRKWYPPEDGGLPALGPIIENSEIINTWVRKTMP